MISDTDSQPEITSERSPPAAEVPANSPTSSLSSACTTSRTSGDGSSEKHLDYNKLLAKMEEANKMIELDTKNALASHRSSRRSSVTSEISLQSGTSSGLDKNDSDPSSAILTEEELWATWGLIVNDWENHWRKKNAWTRNQLRQGVPQPFRGMVWQLLGGAFRNEKNLYVDYIKSPSACEKVIRRDIARTYPEHDFFKEKGGRGQESLFNVMKAYSLHDREVGYCQGSAFIVGLLLMQMPEEEAFAVMVTIMQKHRMRDMFKPSMAELGLCMFQLDGLIQEILPALHVHFKAQESFTTTTFASSWFLTLYTSVLSLPLACRIMDVFLSEGMEIIFKVALALLTLSKDELLHLDMEGMLKYLQKELPLKADADHDALMNTAYAIKFNNKKMKKLEKEYTVMKSKEQEDMAILRNLRQENRLLKQRVELLETESIALVERLVRGQVDRAEGEEETYELTREVHTLHRANVDLRQRLAVAMDDVRSLEMSLAERSQDRQASSRDDNSSAELAECLQRELVRARLASAEREVIEQDLRNRITELEQDGRALREQHVDNSVAHLQDELIAVKLREAEANLSLKDLRQRVTEISDAWTKHQQDHRHETAPSSSGSVTDVMLTPKKLLRAWENRTVDTQKLEEELMSTRIREMKTLAEVKELRLKVMELETQVQVSSNQLRRQDEEKRELKERLDAAEQSERRLLQKQREQTHKYTDLESKLKYEQMHLNIRNVEAKQRIAELEREVSEYKLKNEVIATEGELRNNMGESDKVNELRDRVSDLKAEVMRLEDFRAKVLGRKEIINFSDEDDEDDPVHTPPFARSKKHTERSDSISQYRFSAEQFDMS